MAMVQIRYIFGPKEAGPTRLPVVATEAVLANSAQLRRTRTRYSTVQYLFKCT